MNPWFEIDFLRPTSVYRLHMKNRADCCQDPALPLPVEVSADRSNWQEVARGESSFIDWEPSFPPVRARYLRPRVPLLSTFHLEQVKVY